VGDFLWLGHWVGVFCCCQCFDVVTLPTGAVAKFCNEYVCLSPRISPEPHTWSLPIFFVQVACVHDSVLQHVDDRPYHISVGRGDGSAQHRRSVIYDCFVSSMTGRACGLQKPVPVILKVAVLEQMEKESE